MERLAGSLRCGKLSADFTVVHAPRFFGKVFAYVFGVLSHLARPLHPGRMHGMQLLSRFGTDFGWAGCCYGHRCGRSKRRLGCNWNGPGWLGPQVDTRSTEALGDLAIAADRALHQLAQSLALKIIFRCKPAFKDVARRAMKIQHFHDCNSALAVDKIAVH